MSWPTPSWLVSRRQWRHSIPHRGSASSWHPPLLPSPPLHNLGPALTCVRQREGSGRIPFPVLKPHPLVVQDWILVLWSYLSHLLFLVFHLLKKVLLRFFGTTEVAFVNIVKKNFILRRFSLAWTSWWGGVCCAATGQEPSSLAGLRLTLPVSRSL